MLTVFGCPSYFTDGGNILNDSILYSFIAVLCKISKVFDKNNYRHVYFSDWISNSDNRLFSVKTDSDKIKYRYDRKILVSQDSLSDESRVTV